MEIKFLNFLGLIILIWLFVEGAAPIQWLKRQLKVDNYSKTDNVILLLILKLVNCSLCSGFWIGLIYYQNILYACIVAFCAEVFSRITKKLL